MPFKKPYGAVVVTTEEEDYGLCLTMPELSVDREDLKGKNVSVASDYSVVRSEGGSSSGPQSKKKRLYWSHDMHISFVKALFQLGGPQGIQNFIALWILVFVPLVSYWIKLLLFYFNFTPMVANVCIQIGIFCWSTKVLSIFI